MKKLLKENLNEGRYDYEQEDTPADQGYRAAQQDNYVDDAQYVALKIATGSFGSKSQIKALAVGTKEEMQELKKSIEKRNAGRSYGVSYYIAIHRIG